MAGPATEALLDGYGFPLDHYQQEAVAALDGGRSVLVCAPTGAGKTVVAEYAVATALDRGLRAFYTTPIKALSNQKFHDLRHHYGDGRVGLLTGDNTIDGDAPSVVMTTEVLRNMIYAGRSLDDLAVVVLDEVHYLQNTFRGPVWEEVIIHLPEHVQLVCLSATVSNATEIGDWLTTVRGPTDVIVEERRPVALTSEYVVGDKTDQSLHAVDVLVNGHLNKEGTRFDIDDRPPRHRGRKGQRGRPRRRWFTPSRPDVVDHLSRNDLLPAIVFVFSRNGCDDAVRACLQSGLQLTSASDRRRIRDIAVRHLAALDDADLATLGAQRWLEGLEAGIAAHHAGHVPPFKEAVEACFVQGLIKVVFATETLAMGINMPARAVAIERLTKFNGETRAFLTPGEYTQLTGRAGRRGIDTRGTAVVLWSPFVPFGQIAGLAASRSFALTSAFRPTYNMAVNLVRRHDPDEARRLLNQSLAQYQADRIVVQTERHRTKKARALADAEADAICELGDVAEYRELSASGLPRRERRRRLADALERLVPGDVITGPDDTPVAVLSSASRQGAIRLRIVDETGATGTLAMAEFSAPPSVVATVEVERPYAPHDPDYVAAVASRLAAVDSTPAAPVPGAPADHPVAACPDAARHIRARDRADRLSGELAALDRRIAAETDTLGNTFDRILDLLGEWGYVEGWSVTERGQLLAGVYHESELAVAETIARGLFDGLDAPELAAVASVLTYEHRSPTPPPEATYPSTRVLRAAEIIDDLVEDLRAAERDHDLPMTRHGDHGFALLAHEWCAGGGLAGVLEATDLDVTGGDFVRNVRQLIDLVRQVGSLAPDPETRTTARRAVGALERGVVAASVEDER